MKVLPGVSRTWSGPGRGLAGMAGMARESTKRRRRVRLRGDMAAMELTWQWIIGRCFLGVSWMALVDGR